LFVVISSDPQGLELNFLFIFDFKQIFSSFIITFV